MLSAFALLLALLIPAVWVFVRVKPKNAEASKILRFNTRAMAFIAFALLANTIYFWVTTGHSVDRAWWPALAVMFGAFVSSILLVCATVLRYFLLRQCTEGASF